MLIRPAPILIRQNTDGDTAGLGCSTRGSLHHPTQPSAHHNAAAPGYEPSDLASLFVELSGSSPGTYDGDVRNLFQSVG